MTPKLWTAMWNASVLMWTTWVYGGSCMCAVKRWGLCLSVVIANDPELKQDCFIYSHSKAYLRSEHLDGGKKKARYAGMVGHREEKEKGCQKWPSARQSPWIDLESHGMRDSVVWWSLAVFSSMSLFLSSNWVFKLGLLLRLVSFLHTKG